MLNKIVKLMSENNISCTTQPDHILNMKFKDYRDNGCNWQFIVNGNEKTMKVTADEWVEIKLEHFDFAIIWNGWLAGLINPNGGQMAAHEKGANEKTFVKSLKVHLKTHPQSGG